jgi:hypothetical protein
MKLEIIKRDEEATIFRVKDNKDNKMYCLH